MEEIDGKPWMLMPVLRPTREQTDKTHGLTTPDLLGILQMVPGTYSD